MYDLNMEYSRNFALNTAFLFFLSLPGQAIHSQNYDKKIEKLALEIESQVIDWRHWFHENAELSNREFKTSKRIATILKDMG